MLTGKRIHFKVLNSEKIAIGLMDYNVMMHSLSTISRGNLLYRFKVLGLSISLKALPIPHHVKANELLIQNRKPRLIQN